MSIEDTFKIQELVARFSNSFDVKDWDGLQACLTKSLDTDYSDLRGTPPETIEAADYVRARRESLDKLSTHHLSGNVELEYSDKFNATCRVSMVIWRKSVAEEFTTHCMYTFKLTKIKSDWKISGITQKVFWNEGNSAIHQGAK
jgi:hypothetical protein